jgi:predicted Zn-dependent protease with MMP-like domain
MQYVLHTIFNMDKKSFEKLLLVALEELPIKFRRRMENVEIVIESKPSKELLEKQKVARGTLLLGLYQGVPATKRGFFYTGVLPDKITVFRENIEKISASEEKIKETLKNVIIHEIGHYYGLSERDMK